MDTYDAYSDADLIEAYSSMMDYSGKPNEDMLIEIEKRGGMASFLKLIESKKTIQNEITRVTGEVYHLSSNTNDIDFIKNMISSDILSKKELDELIDKKFESHQAMLKDRSVNSKTIFGSMVGAIIGSLLGAAFWYLAFFCLREIYLLITVPIYIVNYIIIKLITKQSRNNLLVFVVTLLATICSVILGFYFISL